MYEPTSMYRCEKRVEGEKFQVLVSHIFKQLRISERYICFSYHSKLLRMHPSIYHHHIGHANSELVAEKK